MTGLGCTREMQSSHDTAKIEIAFDDPNLIADAGLVPVVTLAERVGLPGLVTERVRIVDAADSGGANAAAKVMSLLARMVAAADSIADTDRLRLAAMDVAFGGVRAPSTLDTFLRSFTHGHVRQLHSVHRAVLAELATATAVRVEGFRAPRAVASARSDHADTPDLAGSARLAHLTHRQLPHYLSTRSPTPVCTGRRQAGAEQPDMPRAAQVTG